MPRPRREAAPVEVTEDSRGEVRLCTDTAAAARQAQVRSDHTASALLNALDLRLQDLAASLPLARAIAPEPLASALDELAALL